MATDTMTSPLSMVSQVMPDVEPPIINGATYANEPMDVGDDRSSSLSELGERGGRDEPQNEMGESSDAIDTEAETERLEVSPQKIRKHQNVVLSQANRLHEDEQDPIARPISPSTPIEIGLRSNADRMEPTSEISSLADSGEDIDRALSDIPSSPRKRKRSSLENDSISDRDSLPEPSTKTTKFFRSTSAGALVEDPYPGDSAEEDDQALVNDAVLLPISEAAAKKSPETVSFKQNYRRGKRKGKKISNDDVGIVGNGNPGAKGLNKHEANQGAVSSNEGEDDDNEAGDVPCADNAVKTEGGVIQKKTALDSLNAMEKCFATLRDKLFDERLAQCNEELAMLQSPIPTHPELLAMKDVIDQRRDGKVQYEQNLLKYKLQTLQRESIANKAQAHAQYMQTARDIRDSHLEKLNKNFYQLQRERRNVEGDVPDYMFEYISKRSQQITQQTAYNTEVSILSGMAKYVGFPAAPDIPKARPKEIEDDLRSMGIFPHGPQAMHNHPPILRAASSFPRQRSGADEHFLEQNPWANPQHPSHHQPRQQLHRQISALSRTATPSATPAAQRRVVDLTEAQGSASTIPDNPSGPNSSVAATPATAEAVKPTPSSQTHLNNNLVDLTPSRVPGGPFEATPSNLVLFESSTDRNKASQAAKSEQSHSPSLPKHTSQDTQTPNSLPKPLPFMHIGGSSSTPAPRTSSPGRFTVINAEDSIQRARHSSMPRYHTPPVSTVANGLMNRFAA